MLRFNFCLVANASAIFWGKFDFVKRTIPHLNFVIDFWLDI